MDPTVTVPHQFPKFYFLYKVFLWFKFFAHKEIHTNNSIQIYTYIMNISTTWMTTKMLSCRLLCEGYLLTYYKNLFFTWNKQFWNKYITSTHSQITLNNSVLFLCRTDCSQHSFLSLVDCCVAVIFIRAEGTQEKVYLCVIILLCCLLCMCH